MSTCTLALLGCGLMGGSFALAAQKQGLCDRVIGYSVPTASATHLQQLGIVHQVVDSPEAAVAQAHIVLLAAPVTAISELLRRIAPVLPKHCLIMDVGSTKLSIQHAAKRYLGEHYAYFVPAHPIAGKEQAGHSDPIATLYQHKKVVLCPDTHTHPKALDYATQLWQRLGAKPVCMSAATHDRRLAAVSHLPHLIAFAYMDALLAQTDSEELLANGGPGFRDFSRIAGCEASIWRDILIDNQDCIRPLLDQVRHSLDKLESLMVQAQPQVLEATLSQASQARINWNKDS